MASVSPEVAPLNITLEGGKTVLGQLSDFEGKPVAGAEVYLFMLEQNGVPTRKQIATTNTKGQFSWSHAPQRPMTLLFLSKGYEGTLKDFGKNASERVQVKISKEEKE